MSKLWFDEGTIMGVDVESRAIVYSLEIPIPLAAAQEALRRVPNIDSDEVVSWGGITDADAELLLKAEPDPEERLVYLEEVACMMQRVRDRRVHWCVYYPRRSNGQ
ncbi:Hypothetical protein A7982_04210 [Minicystis rosea]|nr:Hypothetical protein A7982_04210 [Minicystis rosea]